MTCARWLSPLGPLLLETGGDVLTRVEWCRGHDSSAIVHPVLAEAVRQLEEYFAGERRAFSLPLRAAGTPFRREVWDAIALIPYGEVTPYGALASRLGRPGACRAVAGACGANPLCIVVPCHRVVSVSFPASLGGYTPDVRLKRALLRLEGCLDE